MRQSQTIVDILHETYIFSLQFTWKMPQKMEMNEGAALLCNYGTAYLALTMKANVQPG